MFILHLVNDHESFVGQFVQSLLRSVASRSELLDDIVVGSRRIVDLRRLLAKHRKPKRNAERDAEIMRLSSEGKSAGQIVMALRAPHKLTDKMVNAVISRERKRRAKS